MREIKFRAYVRKETFDDLGANMHLAGVDQHEELIQVRDISFEEKVDYVTDKDGNEYSFSQGNLISVMQYTGLKDRNGKEIYEGDIVKYQVFFRNGEQVGVVEWSEQSELCVDIWLLNKLRLVEVIGNKFEHPHLLEEK